MELQKFPDYLHISRKWFGFQTVFMTVFAVFWNGFLYNFFNNMGEDVDLFARLFPLIHVAAGVGISYHAIAGWFNRSNVFVSKEAIEINYKPIPWFGNKKLLSSDLKQIYAKEHILRNNNNTTIIYEVHAILRSGTNTKLLGGLENSEQALYIEQEIEKYLNIKNAPVRGEVS